MWHSWGCSCGCTFSPIIYEEGSIHMDQHVFDQWNFSHAIWGFALGAVTHAPRSVAAWKIGFLFVLWEFWENVVEVAFSTYAPGQYMGDSVVNSVNLRNEYHDHISDHFYFNLSNDFRYEYCHFHPDVIGYNHGIEHQNFEPVNLRDILSHK